jgi:hypothetical protein
MLKARFPHMKLYRYDRIELEHLPDGSIRIHKGDVNGEVDTPRNAGLLLFCNVFRSIEDHVRLYVGRFPDYAGERATLVARLQLYAAKGFLIEEKKFIAELAESARATHSSDISSSTSVNSVVSKGIEMVAIPTANRPEELDRALETFIANCTAFGRTPEFVVADDSSTENLPKNQEIVRRHASTYSGKVTHLDYAARQAMAEKLSLQYRSDKEVVMFTLCGDASTPVRIGSLRNSILLYAAGRKFLSIDDDVICHPRLLPGNTFPSKINELVIGSVSAQKTMFFPTYESAVDFFPQSSIDYLAAHERMLGKSVAEVILEAGVEHIHTNTDSSGMTDSLVEKLRTNLSEQKVALSHSGFIGHSWTRFQPPTMVSSHSDPHYRLWGTSEDEYKRNRDALHLARINSEFALYKGTSSVSLNIGIDSSQFLPPFMPLYRSQDSVFGYTLQMCFPTIFSGYVPVLVEHKRRDSRKAFSNPVRMFGNIGKTTVYVMNILSRNIEEVHKQRGEVFLEKLGKALIVAAINNREELKKALLQLITYDLNAYAEHSRQLKLQYAEGPDYWQRDMDEIIRTVEKAIENVEGMQIFWDMPEWHEKSDPWSSFFDWIVLFGQVLAEWPELYKASQAIKTY